MKKFRFLVIIGLFVISSSAIAQIFPVPENYSLKTKEDYSKYEQDVINTVDWIQQTPWAEQKENRKIADRFLLQWLTGSPTVNLEFNADALMKICTKNGELLFSFMGAYTKYALQHKESFDKITAQTTGIRSVLEKYAKETDHIKDKDAERFIQMDKDGKLEDWVKTELNKS